MCHSRDPHGFIEYCPLKLHIGFPDSFEALLVRHRSLDYLRESDLFRSLLLGFMGRLKADFEKSLPIPSKTSSTKSDVSSTGTGGLPLFFWAGCYPCQFYLAIAISPLWLLPIATGQDLGSCRVSYESLDEGMKTF
jgi:hypothetical protein